MLRCPKFFRAPLFFGEKMRYYRISGAPFTVKDAEEKQEFMNIINADPTFSEHLICRGINVEQFTGKVNGVAVGEKDHPNRVYIFKCEGNFPTLKLYQKTSAVVYAIEFPVKEKPVIVDPTVIPEVKPAAEKKVEKVVEEAAKVVREVESEVVAEPAPVEEKVEVVVEPVKEELQPAAEFEQPVDVFSADPFERDKPSIMMVEQEAEVKEEEQPKKRGRKKKNH